MIWFLVASLFTFGVGFVLGRMDRHLRPRSGDTIEVMVRQGRWAFYAWGTRKWPVKDLGTYIGTGAGIDGRRVIAVQTLGSDRRVHYPIQEYTVRRYSLK